MKQEIIIDISDTGEVRLETRGFSGPSCIVETAFIKELLGNEQFRSLTPAFYNQKQKIKKYLQLCG